MRFVPVKTAEQQAALMLVGLRERLIRNRTQLANGIRGYAAEFGLIAATGLCKIGPLLERIAADASLPALARELFAIQAKEYALIEAELKVIDAKLMAWHRDNACSWRLSQIPGVGPVGASMLVMKTPDPRLFRSGRQFAVWLGLTPKEPSTADKVRLGVITRAGDEALRSTLISGPPPFFGASARGAARSRRPGYWICFGASRQSSWSWHWPTRSPASPGSSW